MFEGKRYWIVGASEGLGRALAEAMHARGARLILSARNGARLDELAARLPGSRAVPVDVTDPASVATAAAETGDCDGVIYSVGLYTPLAAQDWDSAEVLAMTAANYTGALHVLGHVLPRLIARGQGHVVLIGSLAGFRGLPGSAGYGSSKAALMHLGETLHADLRGTGIRVQIANPGFIRTRLTEKNDFRMPSLMEPDEAADHVIRAMESGRFSTSFPRPFSWVFTLGRFLPRALFYRLFF